MRHAVILPPYGYITGDPTTAPGERGTRRRVEKVCELVRSGTIPADCILPFPQSQGLGENIKTYVRSLDDFKSAITLTTDKTWGTFADTICGLEMIAREVKGEPTTIHFVSDWSQLGRLWIIWRLAFWEKPINWHAKFHLVRNFRTARDILGHEPAAYAKCVVLGLRRRFKI